MMFFIWYGRERPLLLGAPRQLTAGVGWEAEPAVAPDGDLVAYVSNESGSPDIWLLDLRGGDAVRLTDDPAADRSPNWLPDGRGLLFVSDRGGRPAIWKISRLGGPPSFLLENAEDPAVSPDGLRLAFSRWEASGFYRIGVAALDSARDARLITTPETGLWDHRKPAWSPDGALIAYQTARDIWVVSATGTGARRLTTADAADAEPVWSPDGKYIYFSSNRDGIRALWRVAAAGGDAVRLTGGQGPERHPSISRDGSRIVYSTFVDNSDIVLRDLSTGREQRLGGERTEEHPVLSADSNLLAFVSDRWMGRRDVWLQRLAAMNAVGEPRRLTDQAGSVAQLTFSPDGLWIAYHHVLDGQRDVWTVPTNGGPAVQFTNDPALDVEPDWSPDGRHLVFVSGRDGTNQLWVAPVVNGHPAGAARRIKTGTAVLGGPTWSPDGATIAFVGSDSDVWIVAADGLTPARRVTRGAEAFRLCWNRSTGDLWASGLWGSGSLSIRIIDVRSGDTHPPPVPIVLSSALTVDFDLSRDGQRVAYARQDLRGDLWVQEIQESTFFSAQGFIRGAQR